jgi:hypothetical protein
MTFFPLLFILFSFSSLAQRQKIDPISFGRVKLSEDRKMIDLSSFKIKSEGKQKVNGRIIKDTLQWVRLDQSLLIPRVLIEVSFKADQIYQYSWQYSDQKIIPLYNHNAQTYEARIFVSLFESLPLELFENGKVVNRLRISPDNKEGFQLVDFSCAPYFVKISGIKNDSLSVGCRMQRTGEFGAEKPYLEVLLTSASFRLRNQSPPPYIVIFHKSGEASISLIDDEGNEEVLTVAATVPKKLSRFKLAVGLGPYDLETKDHNGNRKYEFAPTAMLYGNFYLNESSSLRFFDSFSRNEATFHNWGLYFAWDLAEFCDQRCLLTSLIGLQGVDYRYSPRHTTQSEVILPQGFEFIYKHAFGKPNYRLSYGMFASLSGLYDYQNIWLRYGKSYFWELNYIEWQRDRQKASMIGLSIGFPIASFF